MQLSGCGNWLEGIDVAVRFNYGDTVKVKNGSPAYMAYKNQYCGCTGYVERISGNRIGVALEGKHNKLSGYGVFWFDQDELNFVNETDNKEEYFMDNNYKKVKAKYLNESISKRELVFAAYEPFEVNDYVVVKSGHHGFVVAKVTAVENVEPPVQYGREIICKVDMSAYEDRKARAKRKAELKGKMEAKVKELQETAIFEMLAKEDAGLAEMLKEFKELG